MDFSKTTLQDLNSKKTDKLSSEHLNHESFFIQDAVGKETVCVGEQSGNYDLRKDFKMNLQSDQMELCGEEHVINFKRKQLQPSVTQNSYNSVNELTDGCSNKMNCNSYSQDTNQEQPNTFVDVLKSSSFLKSNLCDKDKVVEQTKSDDMSITTTTFLIKETNKNVKKFQKEIDRAEVLDEAETIEKIAEMIAKSSKNLNENNPKTKKRLQILMSRNYNEQDWNDCVESGSNNTNIKTNISPLQINEDDSNHNIKLSDDSTNKKKKYLINSQKRINDFQDAAAKIENNATSEENLVEKSRFEEIEDKLEEMFAGIEDEQLVNTTTDYKNTSKNKVHECPSKNVNNAKNKNEIAEDNCLQYDTLNKSSLPTKAAKKSTTPFSNNANTKHTNLLLTDQTNLKISRSILFLNTMPPRRRLSIETNAELLKSVMINDELNKKKGVNDLISEKDVTSQPVDLKTQEVKKERKDVPKNRIKNKKRSSSEYKKELTYIKSNNRNNKTNVRKAEAPSKKKRSQQKIKQQRIQRLLSSENDNEIEERPLQTKDIEIKHRSPFILVKNNGSITVVNTVTTDDSSEKCTRSKKTSNYVYERKTVKGCHSSTLSNRYDADTADSSWICVFCKLGPHKKGLGDLFGPYIITSDCDEYRSIKDSSEKFPKRQRTDVPYINFSNTSKSIKYLNNTLISDVENVYECNDLHSSNSYRFGMPQISNDCYEIWIHEECAIWAPNIFVVGSRLAGLEDATWNSMLYECVHCLKYGALLCCLQRDCKTTSHVPCARECNWLLDESRFWAYCNKHALNKL